MYPVIRDECSKVLGPMASKIIAGCDAETVAKAGEDLLLAVSRSDCTWMARRLLEAGVSPDCMVPPNLTWKNLIGTTPLVSAAVSGDLGMARVLVEGGADIEKPFNPGSCSPGPSSMVNGFTPLMIAAEAGHAEVVR